MITVNRLTELLQVASGLGLGEAPVAFDGPANQAYVVEGVINVEPRGRAHHDVWANIAGKKVSVVALAVEPIKESPPRLSSAEAVASAVEPSGEDRFVVILLNANHEEIHRWTDDEITPGPTFSYAIRQGAKHIAVVRRRKHAGIERPEEVALAQRLLEAGDLLGVPLVDFVLVGSGEGNWVSFKQEGKIA